MEKNSITLRIFSGIHLGAEISLPQGTFSVGKDDSCDIILRDSSLMSRHVQFSILQELRMDSGTADNSLSKTQVRVTNLDGQAKLLDEELEDGSLLQAGTCYFVGQVCFAWLPYAASNEEWDVAVQSSRYALGKDTTQQSFKQETEDSTAPLVHEEDIAPHDHANKIGATVDKDVGTFAPSFIQTKSNFKRYAAFFLAFILLCALTITVNDTFSILSNNVKILREAVNNAGFSSLDVLEDDKGIRIQGYVKDDYERGEILKLARKMHFPVHIDVKVQDDLANAIRAAYNEQGFYPEVTHDKTLNGIMVNAYIKDKLTFYYIEDFVKKNIPVLNTQSILYNIHHADEVEKALNPVLRETDLGPLNVQYLSGSIIIQADLDPTQKGLLDVALKKVGHKLNIPLMVDVVPFRMKPLAENTSVEKAAVPISDTKREIKTSSAPTMSFEVTSVILEPIKFITLGSGERVFEGGLLPGGYTLYSIGTKQLTLDYNGTKNQYQLK